MRASPVLESPVRWVSAFLDVTTDQLEPSRSFWCVVTGSTPGQVVGDPEVVRRTPRWTVMRDPVGMVYCNTGRRAGAV